MGFFPNISRTVFHFDKFGHRDDGTGVFSAASGSISIGEVLVPLPVPPLLLISKVTSPLSVPGLGIGTESGTVRSSLLHVPNARAIKTINRPFIHFLIFVYPVLFIICRFFYF